MKQRTGNGVIISKAQRVYGSVVYWITITSAIICVIGPTLALANIERSILNPHYLFAAIWRGEDVNTVWQEAAGGFPGGHFYLEHFFAGDGFTQFGIALGSSAALWGLLAASWAFIKERSYGYALVCLFVSAIIIFSALGVVEVK